LRRGIQKVEKHAALVESVFGEQPAFEIIEAVKHRLNLPKDYKIATESPSNGY
jgi:hypothetical protein